MEEYEYVKTVEICQAYEVGFKCGTNNSPQALYYDEDYLNFAFHVGYEVGSAQNQIDLDKRTLS